MTPHTTEIKLVPAALDSTQLLTEILLFEQSWLDAVDIEQSMQQVAAIVEQSLLALQAVSDDIDVASDALSPADLLLAQLNGVLDNFYLDQTFSGGTEQIADSLLNSLGYLIHYHSGESLTLSMLLNHVLLGCEFDCTMLVIEQQIMLKVMLSDDEYAVIDAACGEQYSYYTTGEGGVLPDMEDVQTQVLDKLNLLQIFLSQQKMAFTQERQFDKALCCTQLLIQTAPDDPYQRRDRGFLLHQLDCFELAHRDFKFFIEQCPHDPAAQMLEAQLEDFDGSEQTVH